MVKQKKRSGMWKNWCVGVGKFFLLLVLHFIFGEYAVAKRNVVVFTGGWVGVRPKQNNKQFWVFLFFLAVQTRFSQFQQCWQFLTVLTVFDNIEIFLLLTILKILIILTNCDNLDQNDNPSDLWHLRHWLQFWQSRTWIHNNLFYLTIRSDSGKHLQFLRCFIKPLPSPQGHFVDEVLQKIGLHKTNLLCVHV